MKLWSGLAITLVVVSALSMIVGAADLSPGQVWESLRGRLPGGSETAADGVVWSLRVPRLLAGLTVGAGLAVAGVAQQAFHRSPVADPYLLGVSAAAGLGAVVGTLVGGVGSSWWVSTVLAATAGSGSALMLRRASGGGPSRLLLVGLASGIALTAWSLITISIADTPRLPTFTNLVFGSLGSATWRQLWPAAVVVGLGVAAVAWRSRVLDLLALGESEAHHVGVHVISEGRVLLASVGAMTGATVALAGVIGFVGLLAPVAIGRWAGASARRRIPAAAVGGMALVVAADTLARLLGGPVEVPIGVVTAAIGGPVLVAHLMRPRLFG